MASTLYLGLMSGTSLDGVDAVLADFGGAAPRLLASASAGFPAELRAELMALQAETPNELQREALAANGLAQVYAQAIQDVLQQAGVKAAAVRAAGVHGQTIRHRPELGFTRQTQNPALLAELAGIDIVADFRSRDIAAGGQGAPLVPAFHQAVFAAAGETRVVANIGGIGNISILPVSGAVTGFDTGPGNVLLDAWCLEHTGQSFDADGAWGAGGKTNAALLATLLADPYFALAPPKSTGRDLFHRDWLAAVLARHPGVAPQDVQATLTDFTAISLANAVADFAPQASQLFACGGGAYNLGLLARLQAALGARGLSTCVQTTAELGVAPHHVEGLAFAWLAWRFTERLPGNLPAVTGAHGPRILGALYPA